MDENRFKIRSYGWTELAMCYHPSLQPDSASRLLRQWVQKNNQLADELKQTGFIPRQRVLTPLQVSVVVTYLGEP